MKVINLTKNSKMYTSNVYFLKGDWNAINDVNVLIDSGRDPSVLQKIEETHTGVGKKKLDKIILTHNHYDHTVMTKEIKKKYDVNVYAFHQEEYVDVLIKEGMLIKAGDRYLEVLHTPGHTTDSICLWESNQKILFIGDTNINFSRKGRRGENIITSLRKLARLDVTIIYPGHGDPIDRDPGKLIRDSLINLNADK
ncbi:MAG TPA: MBL fold metallo-hydrolase [Candidatus Thermoplasmatota archaeon]|nr:MBL fold metallo-hydrolase [Candidatus Thermoplasmatota archaeon]